MASDVRVVVVVVIPAGLVKVRVWYMLAREHMANWAMVGKSCRVQQGRKENKRPVYAGRLGLGERGTAQLTPCRASIK
jgi:hypothetical protein